MTTLLILTSLLPSLLCELPGIPIQVSKETTFITEPLAGDGLPNYALAIQEIGRKEVTPEENGAIPFWQAMGQCDMTDEEFKQLSLAIDLSQNNETKRLIPLGDKSTIQAVVDWLRDTGRSSDEEELRKLAEEYVAWVQANPWKDKDVPPIGKWLAENDRALDLLVEASSKPQFNSPYPNLLVDRTVSVLDIQLQHATGIRVAARALMARAMNRAAENDLEGAWDDCRVCIALGGHLASGPLLIEQIVAVAVRSMGMRGALVILSQSNLSPTLARQILADLTRLDRRIDVSDSLHHAERMWALDSMLRAGTGRLGGEDHLVAEGLDIDSILNAGVDLNTSLRLINEYYDRIVQASRIKNREKRVQQLAKLDKEFSEELGNLDSQKLANAFSQTFRSHVVGALVFSVMCPNLQMACGIADQDAQYLSLTKIAAALAVYKTQKGEYPNSLAALTPSLLPEVPLDLYTEKPLRYKLMGEGYLLYSLFENKTDDSATDLKGEIRDGEWHADKQEIEREKCDLVIRIPVVPQPKP